MGMVKGPFEFWPTVVLDLAGNFRGCFLPFGVMGIFSLFVIAWLALGLVFLRLTWVCCLGSRVGLD